MTFVYRGASMFSPVSIWLKTFSDFRKHIASVPLGAYADGGTSITGSNS